MKQTKMTINKTIPVNGKIHATFPKIMELRKQPKSIAIQNYLIEKLEPKRYTHVLSVQETAVALAMLHNADVQKVSLAALLHDVVKWMSDEQLYAAVSQYKIELDPIEKNMPALLHAIVGVNYAIDLFEITDLDILEAIRCHTTGNTSMGIIAKLIYVADFVEPTREYIEAAQVRKIAEKDLNQAVHHVALTKIKFLLQKGTIIHPNTIHTYNSTLTTITEKNYTLY